MADLNVTMTLSVGAATVPVASPSAEMSALLRSFGYEPSGFNRLTWPIGASQWASGVLLLHGDDLETIEAAIDSGPGTLTLKSDGNTVSVTGLVLRSPYPILISGRGGSSTMAPNLYAVPITCSRWNVRERYATKSWNRVAFGETHITGGDAQNEDVILLDLFQDAALPVSFADSDEGWQPFEVHAKGDPATVWIDDLLAETGRIYVYGIDGSGVVQHIDNVNSFATLLAFSEYVQSGGVGYLSTFISDHTADVSPGLGWIRREVPFDVRVVRHGQQDETAEPTIFTPNYSAASIGLSQAIGDPATLHDNYPFIDPDDPVTSGTLDARAEELALAFYRRYRSGSLRAVLAGFHNPTLGGGCQRVTWRLENGIPFTDIEADLDNPLFGFRRPMSPVSEAGTMQKGVRPTGKEYFEVGGVGRIKAVLGAATLVGGGVFTKWSYDWQQVRPVGGGGWVVDADGLNSSTSGPAYNNTEKRTTVTSGRTGSGISLAELPGTFSPVPMSGAVVTLERQVPTEGADTDPWWSFDGTAEIDGECD